MRGVIQGASKVFGNFFFIKKKKIQSLIQFHILLIDTLININRQIA